MTIDNTPAIRAFVEERIKKLTPKVEGLPPKSENMTALDELEMILTLCDGLTKQNELLTKALKI